MDPTIIANGISSVLGLIGKFLPLIPGGNNKAIGEIVKTVGDVMPMAVSQIGATYTGIKNIIASIGSHPATTAEQREALRQFDQQADEAWDKVKGEFDPDSPNALD